MIERTAPLDAFGAIDIRTGTIVQADVFPGARVPAYKLTIDFGEPIGVKRSSAQITQRYERASLIGKQIVAIVNLPPKRIAGFSSEVLVLGVPDAQHRVVLLTPDALVADGARVY